jgi:hypothetical protein
VETRSLEQRIAALEAVEEIKALKYRYLRACDRKDPDAFRDCFVAKGAFIDYGPRVGRFDDADGIAEVFRTVGLKQVDGRYVILDMHHGMHPVIELVGDGQATGAWSLRFRQVNLVDRTERLSAIEYDDRYEIENGQWRIRSSQVTVLWTLVRPLPEGFTVQESYS